MQDLRYREVAPHVSEYVKGNLGKNSLTDEERQDARRVISQRKRRADRTSIRLVDAGRPLRQVKLRDWIG